MLKGKSALNNLLKMIRKQIVEPLEAAQWRQNIAAQLQYPADGSDEGIWRSIQELADEYVKSPERSVLWQMVGELYLLVEWYLNRPVTLVGGVGEKRAEALEKIGIETIYDLLTHYPRAYTDRRYVDDISSLSEKEPANVYGEVVACGVARGRKPRFEVRLSDDTGLLQINFWNQSYLENKISRGDSIFCSGSVDLYRGQAQLNNPDFEIIKSTEDLESSRTLKAIYPLTEGITQNLMRDWLDKALKLTQGLFVDCLPREIRSSEELPPLSWSMHQVHTPDSLQDLDRARRRIIFGEFFFYQLLFVMQLWRVEKIDKERNYANLEWLNRFLELLPFNLTADQKRSLEEIENDLASSAPMHRLLQGDVGTGKTVVAAASLLKVAASGWQTAFMAPTEVLAEQHFQNLKLFLKELPCRVELLMGSMSAKEKKQVRERLKNGEVELVVGTHALIQESVEYPRLGYVVIDEQHRFGVQQRRELREKGPEIDMLIMSATPIPRSLALTAYGDLDITTIKEFPDGDKRIKTELLEQTDSNRLQVYKKIRSGLKDGERAFFVFPAIEENEATDLTAAEKAYESSLQSGFFNGIDIGLIHGRMSRQEKQDVMNKFRSGDIQLLFSTTVIEVGIDVPEASHLVVHDAERFGLAQLHQLRGRIGRAGQQAFCYLFVSTEVAPDSKERLKIMEKTNDGFEISRHDLQFRGIGDLTGTAQSGIIWFKLGNIWEDRKLMQSARRRAKALVENHGGLKDPELILTRRKYNNQYKENQKYVKIG